MNRPTSTTTPPAPPQRWADDPTDLIVSNWTVRGTHTGTAFYAVEPSGQPVEINGTAILRVQDGKIVEHWGGPHCQDGVGLTH